MASTLMILDLVMGRQETERRHESGRWLEGVNLIKHPGMDGSLQKRNDSTHAVIATVTACAEVAPSQHTHRV
jgi:hypothetical protein